MVAVKVPRCSFRDEELRIVGVVDGLCVRKHPRTIVLQFLVKLVVNISKRRAAAPGSGRIATLNHETVDNPVKGHVVVEIRSSQLNQSRSGARGTLFKQLEKHLSPASHIDQHALIALEQCRRNQILVAAGHRIGQISAVGIVTVNDKMQRRASEQCHNIITIVVDRGRNIQDRIAVIDRSDERPGGHGDGDTTSLRKHYQTLFAFQPRAIWEFPSRKAVHGDAAWVQR